MRKSLSLATLAVAMFFTGCQKDADQASPVAPPKSDVSVVDNWLAFKDRSSFETYSTSLSAVPKEMTADQFLQNKESKLNFVSMRFADKNSLVKVPNARTTMKENGIEDDYLASMLSPEGILQIGAWICKLDIPNQKVYALHEKDKSLLSELKKDFPSHDKIKVFSTDDEVLPMLEEGEASKSSARVSILCFKESGAKEDKDDTDPDYYNTDNTIRLDKKLVYQKAGVYFSIQAKCQYQKLVAGIWWSTQGWLGGSWNGEYKVKCKGYSYPQGSGTNGGAGDDKSSWSQRLYESSNALNRYKVDVTFVNNTEGLYSRVYHIEYGY